MMDATLDHPPSKRRPVNLTIQEDVLKEAKALNLNASKAAEIGIIAAVKQAKEREWLENNRDALLAHNKRIDKAGTLLIPAWKRD